MTAPRSVGEHAVALATQGLPGNPGLGPVAVLPLCGKEPTTRHGVHDATVEVGILRSRFGARRVTGIGVRIPPWAVLLDIDPRSGGHETLAELEAQHGPLPATLTGVTGRGDGGRHLWYLRPEGHLTGRLLPGVDVLHGAKYAVVEPSMHPDSGGLYRWERPCLPMWPMPGWLVDLVTEPDPVVQAVPRSGGLRVGGLSGPSLVDEVNRSVTWADVLGPHGWRLVRGDGDSDGSLWRHPEATARASASVRGERLYVYTANTVFAPTEPGRPRGYSRAEALALLEHDGDLAGLVAEVRRTGAIR